MVYGRLVPMAENTDAPTQAEAGYVLNFPTDGTSFSVRENLVDILERELLGPIHGEEELLLAGEKVVEGAGGELRLGGDRLDRRRGVAAGREDALGGIENLAAVRFALPLAAAGSGVGFSGHG